MVLFPASPDRDIGLRASVGQLLRESYIMWFVAICLMDVRCPFLDSCYHLAPGINNALFLQSYVSLYRDAVGRSVLETGIMRRTTCLYPSALGADCAVRTGCLDPLSSGECLPDLAILGAVLLHQFFAGISAATFGRSRLYTRSLPGCVLRAQRTPDKFAIRFMSEESHLFYLVSSAI